MVNKCREYKVGETQYDEHKWQEFEKTVIGRFEVQILKCDLCNEQSLGWSDLNKSKEVINEIRQN